MRINKVANIIIIVGLLAGCGGPKNIKPTVPAPDWVRVTPKEKGRLCAVGASEPTYYKEDGKTYAAENARKELARTINMDIKSIMVDIATEKGGSTEEGSIMQVSSWASDAVLRDSEIIAYWYDEDGRASFKRQGITYALACIPVSKAATDISRSIQDEGVKNEVIEKLQNINER